jgi:membrane protease YdiL (CAAX protease family)
VSTVGALLRAPTEAAASPSLGALTQGRRFVIVAVVVVVYIAGGLLFALGPTAYVLLGIPITVSFQRFVARRPIRALWLRDAPPLHIDRQFVILGALLAATSVVPAIDGIARGNVWTILSVAAIVFGAFPTVYAMRALTPRSYPVLVWTTTVAGAIGIVVFLVLGIATNGATLLQDVGGRASVFVFSVIQYLPSMFVVEEVLFRGGLDSYLHRAGDGRPRTSAIFVSALWGLWHVPLISITPGLASLPLLEAAAILVVFHVATGVPLTIGWRRSGNLAVPGIAHALIDGVRNALLAV